VRRYANLTGEIEGALARFIQDVKSGGFPADEESYHLPAGERQKAFTR